MAHSAILFALGVFAATLVCLPWLWHVLVQHRKLAFRILAWILFSYGLGVWAILPSVLRHLGLPDRLYNSRWMDIFLFHYTLHQRRIGGTIVAAVALLAAFLLQYAVVLAALYLTRHTRRRHSAAPNVNLVVN